MCGFVGFTDELYEWRLKALDELASRETAECRLANNLQKDKIRELERRLERLFMYLDHGTISEDEYKEKSSAVRGELRRVHEVQAEQVNKRDSWQNTVESTLRYLCNADYAFKDADKAARLMILNAIGSKPRLLDKKILIEPHYWVKPIADFVAKQTEETNLVRNSDLQIKNSLKTG